MCSIIGLRCLLRHSTGERESVCVLKLLHTLTNNAIVVLLCLLKELHPKFHRDCASFYTAFLCG